VLAARPAAPGTSAWATEQTPVRTRARNANSHLQAPPPSMPDQTLHFVVTVGRGLGEIAAREILERVRRCFGLSRVEGKVFFSVRYANDIRSLLAVY